MACYPRTPEAEARLRELHVLLTSARPRAPLATRMAWLEELARWLHASPCDELSEEQVVALCALLRAPSFAPLMEAVEDAVLVLAARASALGLASDMLARLPPGPLEQSPFVHLPRACEALRAEVRAGVPFLDFPCRPRSLHCVSAASPS